MFYIFSYFQQTKSKSNKKSIACVANALPLLSRNYYQDSESTAMLASRVLSLAYGMLTFESHNKHKVQKRLWDMFLVSTYLVINQSIG